MYYNICSIKIIPSTFNAIETNGESWAVMFRGDRSVAAKSTSWTWPAFKPGNASTLLEELGLKEHKPDGFDLFSVDFNKKTRFHFFTKYFFYQIKFLKIRKIGVLILLNWVYNCFFF